MLLVWAESLFPFTCVRVARAGSSIEVVRGTGAGIRKAVPGSTAPMWVIQVAPHGVRIDFKFVYPGIGQFGQASLRHFASLAITIHAEFQQMSRARQAGTDCLTDPMASRTAVVPDGTVVRQSATRYDRAVKGLVVAPCRASLVAVRSASAVEVRSGVSQVCRDVKRGRRVSPPTLQNVVRKFVEAAPSNRKQPSLYLVHGGRCARLYIDTSITDENT